MFRKISAAQWINDKCMDFQYNSEQVLLYVAIKMKYN